MANLSNINNKFLVTTTGEVLIGQTANNGNRLQITGADGASYIYLKTDVATTGGRIGFNSDDLRVFNQQASGNLSLGTVGTERMKIDHFGQIYFYGQMRLEVAATETNPLVGTDCAFYMKNTSDTDGNLAVIDFGNSTGFVTGRIGAQFLDAGDRNTDLYFMTRANGGSLTERMRITSAGRVTIKNKPNSSLAYDVLISLGTGADGDVGYQSVDDLAVNIGASTSSNWVKSGNDIYNTNSGGVGIGTSVTTGGFNVNNSTAGSYYNMSNVDSGNYKYTNPGGRLLTSNATGWFADGRDPILTLSSSGNSENSAIGNSIGLNLYTNSYTHGNFSPLITFSALSDSGSYASTYAAIAGRKTNRGPDTNWNTGDLCFWTTGPEASNPASYMQQTPTMIIKSGGNVGIGTPSPVNKLEAKGLFAAPLTTGSAQNGIARFSQTSGVGSLDIGFGDPYSWLQSRSSSSYATNYNLALNPNGGNVGIGTTTVNRKLTISDSVGSNYLVSAKWYKGTSSFSNPFIVIVSNFTNTSSYPQIIIKINLIGHGISANRAQFTESICTYDLTNGDLQQTTISHKTVGTSAVAAGVFSVSGTSIGFTPLRQTNYDQFKIEADIQSYSATFDY